MKIKAFFLFPETDDDFVKIGDDPQVYKDLINEISVIKHLLRKNQDYELHYNSTNTDLFLNKVESLIAEEHLSYCRKQLLSIFSNSSRNVLKDNSIKTDCKYACWHINDDIEQSNILISEAAESMASAVNEAIVVVNIAEAYKTTRNHVYVIKDAIQYEHLPQLISLPIAWSDIGFAEWVLSLSNQNFSLRDKSLFIMTSYRWRKQTIYKRIETGDFWYYDYFHKDNKQHYEVFDQAGIHKGEANTNGILDTSKAEIEKKIDFILH